MKNPIVSFPQMFLSSNFYQETCDHQRTTTQPSAAGLSINGLSIILYYKGYIHKAETVQWSTPVSGAFLQAGLLQSTVTVTIQLYWSKLTLTWMHRECLHDGVNAHISVRWSNKRGAAAVNKQTGPESFMVGRLLLRVLNACFQRFLQCLPGFAVLYCIALLMHVGSYYIALK